MVSKICVQFVGSSRTDGRGTDGPDDDGFTMVEKKKERKNHMGGTVSWAEVVKSGVKINVAESRGQESIKRNKSVSGSLSRNNPVSINGV